MRISRLKFCLIVVCLFFLTRSQSYGYYCLSPKFEEQVADSLPIVLSNTHLDQADLNLKSDAARLCALHRMPETMKDWIGFKKNLIAEIILKTKIAFNHELPLDVKETGVIQMRNYSVRNIYFQTRPGIYATANLYVPDGKGRFPAVIVMMGHSQKGRLDDRYQSLGHTLALNGYVALCIDPWGSGERTTIHGVFEDHGDENNLGSALLNIGEPLMGLEISDNIRGVDLLCSLAYVDAKKIGATGSSGGGNQTMWLAAIDERIKAAVPVVSAGTFESYVMGTPCICEVLQNGLNLTEEAGIISLIAPRAVKLCNHLKDNNQAFRPNEMIRTYTNAKPVFVMYGAGNNISYNLFDLPHGYFPQDREAMLGWFDLHLKGTGKGEPKKEIPFEILPFEKIMVFKKGQRDPKVIGTATYCINKGNRLKTDLRNLKSFNLQNKRDELSDLLGIKSKLSLTAIHEIQPIDHWNRFYIETTDNKVIPLLVRRPLDNSNEFVILTNPQGKEKIPKIVIDKLVTSGKGIAILELSGTGELIPKPNSANRNGNLLILSRSLLWFGKTVIGEWVNELNLVVEFLKSRYSIQKYTINADKESAIAALFMSALGGTSENLILTNAPVSYLFDSREGIDFFSHGINIPGVINWGDLSMAAALSNATITFIAPVTMSGNKLDESELNQYKLEYNRIKQMNKCLGNTLFINSDTKVSD